MDNDLLKLLRLLIDAMPRTEGGDGNYETNREQQEAYELLHRLEREAERERKNG